MKWLLVEDWASHIYAEPFFQRLLELGEEVHAFKEFAYFSTRAQPIAWQDKIARAQKRLRFGPRHVRLNVELLAEVERLSPDIVFIFRGDQIHPSALTAIRQRVPRLICWHNDNPFSPKYPWFVWRHARRSIHIYDHLYAYRHENLEDFHRAGAKSASLLRSFYLRELNYPLQKKGPSAYSCDVSFIGHWEDDGREDYIRALLDEPGIDFKLWGTLWERSRIADRLYARFGDVRPLYKEAYNEAMNASRISLVFLSGLNRDTYTRRCFEIPAAGTFMLAQYTEDLASMFGEGLEAEYFRSPEEMVAKATSYLRDPDRRVAVATQGRERLLRDGHEAEHRARTVLEDARRLIRGA